MSSKIFASENFPDFSSCHLTNPRKPAPHTEIFFPLGFPLQIRTNCEEILHAAPRSWSSSSVRYSHNPLIITLIVNPNQRTITPLIPESRIDKSLLIIQADAANYIVSDLDKGQAWGEVSAAYLDSLEHLRYYFLEAAALSMISALRAVALHAACVTWRGCGILLCGESGAGKSSLAYACARLGWGYVSDDASYLMLEGYNRRAIGNSNQIRFRDSAPKLFPELVGRPITYRAAGKPSIEVPTSELSHVARNDSAEIAYIVFLKRDRQAYPGLRPLPAETARNYFHRFLLLPPDKSPVVVGALERLLQAERFELSYTDVDQGVELMKRLIEETLSCRSI